MTKLLNGTLLTIVRILPLHIHTGSTNTEKLDILPITLVKLIHCEHISDMFTYSINIIRCVRSTAHPTYIEVTVFNTTFRITRFPFHIDGHIAECWLPIVNLVTSIKNNKYTKSFGRSCADPALNKRGDHMSTASQ